jgi:hypothetical protein
MQPAARGAGSAPRAALRTAALARDELRRDAAR